ncbi:MAG: hypothetical protein AMXMBFR64_05080 [Myxococcales bacterium]
MANEALTRRQNILWKSHTGGYNDTLVTSSGMAAARVSPPAYTPGLALFGDEAVRSGPFALPPKEGSLHGGTLTFRGDLLGLLATAPTGNPTGDLLSAALKQLLGGQVIAGYAEAALTAWAASAVGIDNGVSSALYKAGGAVIGRNFGTGKYEMAIVKQVTDGGGSDHTLATLFPLVGTAPHATATTWGTVGSYLTDAAPTAITFWAQSKNTTGLVIYGGCVCTAIKLDGSSRANPMVDFTFSVNDVRTDTEGAALVASAYTQPQMKPPTANNGGRLVVGTANARWHSLSIELGATVVPLEDHNALHGVGDVLLTDQKCVLKFKTVVTGAFSGLTTLPAQSPMGLHLGTAPGQMHAIVMPAPTLTAAASIGDEQGTMVQEWTAEAGQCATDTGADGITNSPFRWYQG